MYEILSETQQLFNGEKYYLCGSYFQRKGVRLHRKVWECSNGKIPDGYHVHHIDGNVSNNNIENLELLLGHDHLSIHGSTENAKANAKRSIEIARPFAVMWHKSAEAKEFYKEHSREWAKKVKPVERVCSMCGKKYMTKKRTSLYCSNACRSSARRSSGVDNEWRTCSICGTSFEVNKYEHARCCSRSCAGKLRSRAFCS